MNKRETILVTVLAMLCGIVGGGFSHLLYPRETVNAREFRVVDRQGRERARFGMSNDAVGLELVSEPGKLVPRASFFLDTRGGALEIVGAGSEGGAVGVGVGFDQGLPLISLVDGSSGGAVLMGSSGISLAQGDNIRSLAGNPGSSHGDAPPAPVSTLVLYDGQGEVVWAAPQSTE